LKKLTSSAAGGDSHSRENDLLSEAEGRHLQTWQRWIKKRVGPDWRKTAVIFNNLLIIKKRIGLGPIQRAVIVFYLKYWDFGLGLLTSPFHPRLWKRNFISILKSTHRKKNYRRYRLMWSLWSQTKLITLTNR
jgi:hypothetical protein